MFEKHEWDGIVFESQRRLAEKWTDRKIECINIALGDIEKKIYFKDENKFQGWLRVKKAIVVRPRRLEDVLLKRKKDVVAIDVEDYEYSVLDGIDFSKVDI